MLNPWVWKNGGTGGTAPEWCDEWNTVMVNVTATLDAVTYPDICCDSCIVHLLQVGGFGPASLQPIIGSGGSLSTNGTPPPSAQEPPSAGLHQTESWMNKRHQRVRHRHQPWTCFGFSFHLTVLVMSWVGFQSCLYRSSCRFLWSHIWPLVGITLFNKLVENQIFEYFAGVLHVNESVQLWMVQRNERYNMCF